MSDVHHVARHLRHRPQESIARLAGLPWRARLPFDLAEHCREIGAEGICVQKWLISGALVDVAHRAGLDVNTWTVNDPDIAQTVAVAGVDSITTDRVAALRLALGMGRPPRLPAAGGRPGLRAAGRSAPS